MERKNYFSGAPMELVDGYSRMVQVGPFVFCGGTTSVMPDGSVVCEGDTYGQVVFVLEKLIKIVEEAGGKKEDIYSVKIYQTPEYDKEAGRKAFCEVFDTTKPVMTEIPIFKLTRPSQIVEIEMNGICGCHEGVDWEGISLKKEVLSDTLVKMGPFVYGVSAAKASGAEGWEMQKAMLKQAGVEPEDIIKVKQYATSAYVEDQKEELLHCIEESVRKAAVFSQVIKEGEKKECQLEITAIAGSGEGRKQGEISWTKKATLEDFSKKGWAAFVKCGPFLYGGLRHSLDENDQVVGVGDSQIQESYVIKQLTEGMLSYGITPEHMVKFKGYYTTDFGPLYGETSTPYYEEVYKPIKPLYTGVYVSQVGKEEEIFEMEMMAMEY